MASIKKKRQWIGSVIIGLIVFAVLLLIIGGLIYAFWQLIVKAPSNISTAIIAVSGTILISLITLIITKSWERKLNIENEMRLKKIPIYEEFMAFWFKSVLPLHKGANAKPPSQDEILKSMGAFTEKVMVWGSDNVVKCFSEFRQFSIGADISDQSTQLKLLIYLEKLIYAIRNDLGHKNYGLKEGTIISLFIKDFHKQSL